MKAQLRPSRLFTSGFSSRPLAYAIAHDIFCTLAKATLCGASIAASTANTSFHEEPSMLQAITPIRKSWMAKRNNPVVRILVGLLRAGANLVAVQGIYLALTVFAATVLWVQWLIGY